MSFRSLKTKAYCVGGRHRCAATNICHKTSKDSKVINGHSSIWNRKISMTVSDNTIQAWGLSDFLKNPGKKGNILSKLLTKNVLKSSGRALGVRANVASALASRNPEAILSTLTDLINFYHAATGLYRGKSFWFYTI